MKHEKISQSIQKAHDGAAFEVALNYLRNLEKDTDNTLGTMSGLVEAFRYDISEKVCRRARFLGASNCKYRPELVLMLAKDYVREALRANPEQADKLQAIRSAQDWKARAEAMAEQAKWVPVPVD